MIARLLSALAIAVLLLHVVGKPHEMAATDRAKAMCRGAINGRLKNPDSAEYGASSVFADRAGGWIVYRSVTATNSFGAMVRSEFKCQIAADFSTVKVTP